VTDLDTNPYVGPRSFEEADSHNFFGRAAEGRQLASLIIAHRVVLFYAQSGAGKTSLLQASVVPALKRRRMMGVLPVTRVGGDLPPGVAGNQVDNIYVFNALLNLEKSASLPEKLVGLSLSAGLQPYLQPENEGQRPRPQLLILDQFEELFTHHPERYPERAAFFSQLHDCLETYPYLSLLLAMREEHIAELDFYSAHMPDRLRTRFRIEFMTRESALEAVREPASHAGRPFEPGVAEELVDNLRRIQVSRVGEKDRSEEVALGKYVEPVHLQIVCHQLWGSLPPDGETIRAEDVRAFGNVDQALALFYEDVIKRVSRRAGVSQRRLRAWFGEQLITPAQTRGLVFRGDRETAGLANEVVDRLDRAYLIRAEIRHGAPWYELSHDRFIAPIQRSNREWRVARQARLIRGVIGASLLILLVVISIAFISLRTAGNTTGAAAAQEVTRAAATNVALQATSTQSAAIAQATAQAANATATQSALDAQAAEQAAAAAQATATQSASDAQAAARVAAATATASAAESSDLALSVARSRVRPLRPGLSLSGASTTAGTIGAFALDGDNQVYLLALNTLLSPAGCELDVPVLQPGRADGGQLAQDVIGSSARCLPLQDGSSISNLLALVRLDGALGYETSIPGIGPLRGVRQPAVGDRVRMLGRSSGLVSGEITDLSAALNVVVGEGISYQFTNAIRTTPMSAAGDAGALVVDEAGYAVGILVAGSDQASVLAPMQAALDSLGVQLLYVGTQLSTLVGRGEGVLTAEWSPDGRLASGSADGAVILWDLASGQPAQILRGHKFWVDSVAWSADGQLASGARDQAVILWNLQSGAPAKTLAGHKNWVWSVAWSPDGGRLASGAWDGTVILWDLDSGQPAKILPKAGNQVWSVAWSPDGNRIVTAGKDEPARIWDATTGEMLSILEGQEGGVLSASFSPDGTRVVTAGMDGTLVLWDLASGQPAQTVWERKEHTRPVRSVDWSRDGKQILTASEDGTARIWDAATGEVLSVLEGHRGEVFSARFSPDGTRIATAGQDGTIRVWQGR
jgi:hypothetical protein